MKMKKVMKIVVAVLMAALLISAFTTCTMAAVNLSQFNESDNSGASNAVSNIIGSIIYIARIIGAGVAIIMLIVLAIKYIASSPEGKSEIKKWATAYIAGAIILFAASAILGIIQNFATGNIGDG